MGEGIALWMAGLITVSLMALKVLSSTVSISDLQWGGGGEVVVRLAVVQGMGFSLFLRMHVAVIYVCTG
jgi:hypothetical protein